MFSWPRLFRYAAVPVVAAALAGCWRSSSGRVEVSGAVKLQGQPLRDGSIRFVPLDGQDTVSGAPVVNGTYSVPRQNGLRPGKYLVQLTSGDGPTPANEDAAAPGGSANVVSADRIPEDWNVRSKQQIEVRPHAGNRFDFEVPYANTRKKR
jgi:hypothetical protein